MRTKIYFAPTPWTDSVGVMEDSRGQSPNNSCIWDNIEATDDIIDAEYLVIQDSCPMDILTQFPKEKRLYFSREALTPNIIHEYPNDLVNRFSFWDGSGYLWTRWWYTSTKAQASHGYGGICKSYTELSNEKPKDKTKRFTCVLSNKTQSEGHNIRIGFTEKIIKKYPKLDLYGSIEFRNKEMPNNDKSLALADYQYCLGFDNQDNIDNFFGTQFTDSVLNWCVPIFWCGTDLNRYFPEKSFIQFNAREDKEIDRIIDLIENDDYTERIGAIAEARDLILNKYNLWPTISNVITNKV